jgi:indolepyruvate ferredoxin oxidoreductase alpha subunit
LLEKNGGKTVLLLGNEAIARGAIEAGVGVVTTYPGTPASEIGDSIAEIAKEIGLYMEYSTNEIVAVEVAAGAAICGVRALTAMKHVGLNVAADAVMTLAYTGVRGGFIIVTADDPECYSSQNEQDNRYYALLSNLPMLEPSNAQEAKDMVIKGIELSEKLELPCLLRTTTRVSHTRSPVTLGPLKQLSVKGKFERDVKRFVMVPANARIQHKILLEKMEKAKKISEDSSFNNVTREGDSFGIISSSAAYNYAVEAVDILGVNMGILKLGMTHPLPQNKIADFIKKHENIIIVEELEPYLELQVKAIAKDIAPETRIYGKINVEYFPKFGELSTIKVVEGIAKILGKPLKEGYSKITAKYMKAADILLPRPPVLCAGCPHRASFYVIRTATGGKALYATDIGCYALGIQPPLQIGDTLICMGASIGIAMGMNRATDMDTIAIVGDSTFFHATIPGLINAVYNNHKVTLVVLDNLTTAMTGHQPHPGTGKTAIIPKTKRILIEDVAKGCGVEYIKTVNPFQVKEAINLLKDAIKFPGPSVIVLRAPCTLLVLNETRKKGGKIIPVKISEECNNCMACIKLLGCPALRVVDNRVAVDQSLCSGCELCVAVCPYKAIRKGEEVT